MPPPGKICPNPRVKQGISGLGYLKGERGLAPTPLLLDLTPMLSLG